MKGAHVSFVSVPIGSHLNQTLPLVETLVRRGYRVSYAVADSFRDRVAAAGAEPISLRLDTLTADMHDEASFCRIATYTLPRIERFYERNRPALLIHDFTALAGRIFAYRNGLPAVRTTPHFCMSRDAIDRQIPPAAFRERVLATSARADAFLAQQGLAGSGYLFFREQLNIHLFPREFEPVPAAVDATCFHAGRCAGEQAPFGDWNIGHARGKPVVLVAPSNSYLQGTDYLEACLEAFSGSPWHVVLSLGEKPHGTIDALPDGFEIVHRTSHTRILPHASIVICMGGMATAAESAYHGVPMIVTSRGKAELEWLAENFVKLGIAVHLRETDFTAPMLRKSVADALENATLLTAVQKLRHSVLRSAGAEETANELELYMQRAAT